MLATDNPVRDDEDRKIALHVNFNEPANLNFVLNNAENIHEYYQGRGIKVEIRIVAHGPGLHMLRDDTSPVKDRINGLAASQDGLTFYACSNTKARMAKAEGKPPPIMEVATMVPSGQVELIELSRAGWTYIKP
jgi:uncharacterized protein